MRLKRTKGEWTILVVAIIAVGILAGAAPENSSRLVSVQQLPQNMDFCYWPESTGANPNLIASLQQENLFSALQQDSSPRLMAALQQPVAALQQGEGRGQGQGDGDGSADLPITERQEKTTADMRAAGARVPVRTVRDLAPTYSAVAVDTNSGEVILQDNNLWSYRVFDRLTDTPPDAAEAKAKRIVRGDKTAIQFNNGLYVDPVNGDIFSVESDTGDKMVRFARESDGNVSPKVILHTPHRVYNIAADEVKQELYVTVEFPPEVVVYPKSAKDNDQPLRRIAGDNTALDAPHGIAVDEKNRLLFVNTWGHHSNFRIAGTGKYVLPAIQVYSLDASGDAKPLRAITGDKTMLNWPAAMKFNPENGDLYVANDIGQSILVFANASSAQGNVGPVRAIKGPNTRLRNPTGVAIDLKNREVWASNLGSASATVYPLMANGDVAPLRIIRSAEESKRSLNFGRTAAVTYDPVRQEILVPN